MALERTRLGAWAAGITAAVAACLVGGAVLPEGLPFGVVLYGLILGGLSSLTAMGLVIVYRAARIINFAQAEIGGLAAAVAVVMVIGWHLPYLLAVPVGLAVAVATGALVDLTVVRTLFQAPRLILTVATIGLAQVLGAAELFLPGLFHHVRPLTSFTTPFTARFRVGPLVFNGNYIVAMIVVPAVLVALAVFFNRSGYGIAIRGAADSNERALLLGIPVRRLSTITWMLAAGLSGLGVILTSPILGPQLGLLAGPEALLAPLAAAVVARLESLTVAFVASLVIGVFEQAVFWSYSRSTTVDVALFAVILAALMFQRRRVSRTDDGGLGGYVAQHEVRPLPAALAALPEVRLARVGLAGAVALAAVVVPMFVSDSARTLLAYIAIFGILAVSLVLLTGWAGQISLGQFAFAGVGAGTTASLFVNAHADLFVALFFAAATGAIAAVLIGVPALRLPGPFLAVTTLAFAVPVSDYLLNSSYFPGFAPATLTRPYLLERFNLNSAETFYYFCLLMLVVSTLVVWNYRRSRPGRTTIAVRDNSRGAQSFGVNPVRSRLVAFAVSGALAGVAGGLYAVGLRGIPFSGYNPETSLQIFTMVVVGGMGSLSGGLLGAFYVQGAQYFLRGSAQLLATGGGILVVVVLFPGGLAEVVFRGRDFGLRRIARRRGVAVPSLAGRAAFESSSPPVLAPSAAPTAAPSAAPSAARSAAPPSAAPSAAPPSAAPTRLDTTRHPSADITAEIPVRPETAAPGTEAPETAALVLSGVNAAYGPVQVLFGVDLTVGAGQIVGLLGTNGSGKSTTLKVAAGLLAARGGRVVFAGEDLTKTSPVGRVERGLVMVPSGRSVFPSLTVRENLRLAGWLNRHDRAFLAETTTKVTDLFPSLARRLDTLAGSLSGGEQQMLTVAQALYCKPKLLMIDELSLGLAPAVVADLLGVVRRLAAEGLTVVVVEQSLNLATSIAGQAVFMERGQVRFSGPTAELAERPDLVRSVFLAAGRRPAERPAKVSSRPRPSAPPPALSLDGGQPETLPPAPAPDGGQPDTLPPAFAALELGRTFGAVKALDQVSFEAARGEILGIIGANGAGKTTLFDICSGFLSGTGRVLLGGSDVTALSPSERSDRGLGRIFQDARLFPSLTVKEVLAVALDRRVEVRDPLLCMLHSGAVADSEAEVAEAVDELVDRLGLDRYRESFISELSTGTRRIVELGCVLAHQPSVLLLDEPTSGLAQRESEALGGLLTDLLADTGVTLVMIEHDVPLVSSIADRLLCLDLGRVIAEGRPGDVLDDPAVVAAYLGTDAATIGRSGRARRPGRPKKAPAATGTPAANGKTPATNHRTPATNGKTSPAAIRRTPATNDATPATNGKKTPATSRAVATAGRKERPHA